jgi:hypothetical protein
MLWSLLADVVVAAHGAFVLTVVLGGFVARSRRRFAWVQLPLAAWGAGIELVPGAVCPLTPLEQALRLRAGQTGYGGSFIEHYLEPVLYPAFLTRELQLVLAALVVGINLWAYAWWWWPRLAGPLRRLRGPQ